MNKFKSKRILIFSLVFFLVGLSFGFLVHAQSDQLAQDGHGFATLSDSYGSTASLSIYAYYLEDTNTGNYVIELYGNVSTLLTSYSGAVSFVLQIRNMSIPEYYTPTLILSSSPNSFTYDLTWGKTGEATGLWSNRSIGFTVSQNYSGNASFHMWSGASSSTEVPSYIVLNYPLDINISIMFLNERYIFTSGVCGYIDSDMILGTLQNGVGGGGSCVSANTLILTNAYKYVPAGLISVGDEILTYNTSTESLQPETVEEVFLSYENYSYIINGNLIIAGDQDIMTSNGYISAANLTVNDTLLIPITNTYIPVFSIIKTYNPSLMVDFKVANNENYIGWYYLLADKIANPCG